MDKYSTLSDFGVMECDICDNVVPIIYCSDCGETVCEYCYDAYPEDYCGQSVRVTGLAYRPDIALY